MAHIPADPRSSTSWLNVGQHVAVDTSHGAPSERLVAQRIRNRIIEYLELAASYAAQEEYQRVAPINVPSEVMNQWEDWVPRESTNGRGALGHPLGRRARCATQVPASLGDSGERPRGQRPDTRRGPRSGGMGSTSAGSGSSAHGVRPAREAAGGPRGPRLSGAVRLGALGIAIMSTSGTAPWASWLTRIATFQRWSISRSYSDTVSARGEPSA